MSKPVVVPESEIDPKAIAKQTRAELVKRVLIVAALVLATAAFGIELSNGHAIRQTQLQGTPTGKRLLASADRILDCTEAGGPGRPAGKCYQRGQQQTAGILASAQQIIVLAAACAVDVTPAQSVAARQAQIYSCITKRLTASPAPKP